MLHGMLARKAMQLLDRGRSERFHLSKDAAEQVASWVAKLPFDGPGDRELGSLLRLIAALEHRLESPAAAQAMIDALQSDPAASDRVRARLSSEEDGSRHAAAKIFGSTPRRAPLHGATPPAGSIPVSQLVQPNRVKRGK